MRQLIGLLPPLILSLAPGIAVSQKPGFVRTGTGVRVHYLQAGRTSSPRALVFIPGWRLPAWLWTGQLEAFAPMARVIAIDPRSQGLSTHTAEGNSPETRARDLHDVLGKLGVSHSVLVGWSQGAQDVAAYLQEFGTGSVSGVVFVDSPVSAGPAEVDLNPEFAKSILSGITTYAAHPEEFSQGMVQSLFKRPHPDIDQRRLVRATLQTPTRTGIAMLVADIFGVDRRPALTRLDVPALVIASSASPLLEQQKAMAATIPTATFVAIDSTAHAVFIDDPGAFEGALRRFLQSLSGWH